MEDLKEFIFENKPTESCHASTVLPLDDGRVVAAWFAGTKESADDVDILTSVRSESGWSEPVRVSADKQYPALEPGAFPTCGWEDNALFQSRQEDTDVEDVFFALG